MFQTTFTSGFGDAPETPEALADYFRRGRASSGGLPGKLGYRITRTDGKTEEHFTSCELHIPEILDEAAWVAAAFDDTTVKTVELMFVDCKSDSEAVKAKAIQTLLTVKDRYAGHSDLSRFLNAAANSLNPSGSEYPRTCSWAVCTFTR